MSKLTLGRLERVDLRETWKSEAGDFTPWLAKEENIDLLGNTIGLELEVEAQEKGVGPFRADILCKDTLTGNWVLIENQLENTDHTHLGQLLTYAAGLNAVTIVWVAGAFTEEHRATLDWLNEITDGRFNFFGLEVELWRIGESLIAPKFNIVCKPNDWTKTISDAANQLQAESLTEIKLLQLDYWTAFREYLLKSSKTLRPQKPLPQHWTNFAIGRSNSYLAALVNTRDSRIWVALVLASSNAKQEFRLLKEDRDMIEKELSFPLDWRELPERKESHVVSILPADPTDKGNWPEQHVWLKERLEAFYRVFSPRVKSLKVAGGSPGNGGEIPA